MFNDKEYSRLHALLWCVNRLDSVSLIDAIDIVNRAEILYMRNYGQSLTGPIMLFDVIYESLEEYDDSQPEWHRHVPFKNFLNDGMFDFTYPIGRDYPDLSAGMVQCLECVISHIAAAPADWMYPLTKSDISFENEYDIILYNGLRMNGHFTDNGFLPNAINNNPGQHSIMNIENFNVAGWKIINEV